MEAKAIAKLEEAILLLENGAPYAAICKLRRLLEGYKPQSQRCPDTADMFWIAS